MKLTIKGLTKSYGSIRALSQFSYEFGPGIYGILGANGAGKSTLFELLTDTLRRDCGEILWNGVDILPRIILSCWQPMLSVMWSVLRIRCC